MKKFIAIFLFVTIFGYTLPIPERRPIFPPFISGDSFRAYSDFAYDELDETLDPTTVTPGAVVFVQTNFLKAFFEKIHPEIPHKYILLTHNSDDPAPGIYKEQLDDEKIIAWFGENYDGFKHEKMHVLPMGTANFSWPNGNGEYIRKVIAKQTPKEHLAHMGLTIQTNYTERWGVFRQFSQAPFVYRTIKKTFDKYLVDVAASKFEIAPLGFAWDTYRLWECLYVGTIPIVRSSCLDDLYEGLPILIIKDWKEVTEAFLNDKYVEFSRKSFNMEKTTMEYWTRIIDTYKTKL